MACAEPNNPADVEAMFPGDVSPQVRMGTLSALRSLGYTPQVVSGAILQALRQHFCDPANIMNHRLRAYLQREGAWGAGRSSGLYIEVLAKWEPRETERRPAILIKENDWEMSRSVIGGIADEDWRLGVTTYLGMWQGTHTIFALGNEGAETQILAAEIARLMVWFSQVFCEQLSLHRFQMIQLGALSAVEESTEHYVAPVTVAYQAEEVWDLQLEAPRLKRITFTADEFVTYPING